MENILKLKEINFANKHFWLYFLLTNYPNGYDGEHDISISECIDGIGELDISWVKELTRHYDGVMEESDGYIENPTTLNVPIRENLTLRIEFHPGDTIYFLNQIEIGCTGPHWKMYCITWEELMNIAENNKNGEYLFHLLLPMTAISKNQTEYVYKEIEKRLIDLNLPADKMTYISIAKCLTCGILMDESFENVPQLGVVSTYIHSARFVKEDNAEEIKRINDYIIYAQNKNS